MNVLPTRPGKFSVTVNEGSHDDDISVYFCREEPVIVQRPVVNPDGSTAGLFVTFVYFIPRNGHGMRVNRPTLVPMDRVVAISEDVPDAD